MLLTNPEYFAFLALVFFAWWPLVRHRLSALALIAFANLFFYARWSLWYLALVPAASFIDFSIGIALDAPAAPESGEECWSRRAWPSTSG